MYYKGSWYLVCMWDYNTGLMYFSSVEGGKNEFETNSVVLIIYLDCRTTCYSVILVTEGSTWTAVIHQYLRHLKVS